MSPPSLLVSLLLLLVVVVVGLASVSGESLDAPYCPVMYQSQDGNPPGWPSDWGYASTGTYYTTTIRDSLKSESQTFAICAGSGCGPACCWHANGFAFWASTGPNVSSEAIPVPSCSVNINFNGDSRTYTVDPVKLEAINYVGVDGFMANEGNWVNAAITCNTPVIGMFSYSSFGLANTCGGIPSPGPICSWTPLLSNAQNPWAAFYVDRRCNAEEMMMAYGNSTAPHDELSSGTFETCAALFN